MADSSIISTDTKKRLISDIKDIYKNPLDEQGIYYVHDDFNMLKGYAMIIGPKGTPYKNGFYLFEFDFPTNYPYSPPLLTYRTNNGTTRFNPNLYVAKGKVCLSILNTWSGESWSSCQSIRSILLTITGAVLNDNPLLNEPGIKMGHPDVKNYIDVITYTNYKTSLLGVLNRIISPDVGDKFREIIDNYMKNNKYRIMGHLGKLRDKYPHVRCINIGIYNFKTIIKYEKLYEDFEKYYNSIE